MLHKYYFDVTTAVGDCEAGFMRVNDLTPCGKLKSSFTFDLLS